MTDAQINGLIWEFVLKYGGSFLASVGLISLWVMRKRLKTFFRDEEGDDSEMASDRRQDDLLERFLTAYENGVNMIAKNAEAVNNLAAALREQSSVMRDGFTEIHRRIDAAILKGKIGGHS